MQLKNSPSLIQSLFSCRCPKCRKGSLFVPINFKKLGSLFIMNPTCQACGQTFEPEPGFYFGAMFISYAMNTALFILVWVIYSNLTSNFSIAKLLILMAMASILLLPVFFRLSRTIWIYIFIRFDSKALVKD